MLARLLEAHETPLAKELWGYAFERDEPFYSWYFNEVFNPRNCVGLYPDSFKIFSTFALLITIFTPAAIPIIYIYYTK